MTELRTSAEAEMKAQYNATVTKLIAKNKWIRRKDMMFFIIGSGMGPVWTTSQ